MMVTVLYKCISSLGQEIIEGAFNFNSQNTVVCINCHKELKYQRSNMSLTHHLSTKHNLHRFVIKQPIYKLINCGITYLHHHINK